MGKRKITSYKEYEESLKTGKLKLIKGLGRAYAYNSIELLKTRLERDYSEALEDSIVHIISYINYIEQENEKIKADNVRLKTAKNVLYTMARDEEQWRIKIAKENSQLVKECLNHIEQKKLYKKVIVEVKKLVNQALNEDLDDLLADLEKAKLILDEVKDVK